jgi:hypothetical protein
MWPAHDETGWSCTFARRPTPRPKPHPAKGRSSPIFLEAEREAALESLRYQEQAVKEERFRASRGSRASAAREEISLLSERCDTLKQALKTRDPRSGLEADVENARQSSEAGCASDRALRHWRELRTTNEGDITRLEAQLRIGAGRFKT